MGEPLSWPLVQARVDSRIEGILESAGAKTYQIYLTSEDKSNFRIEVASIRPYKGHRDEEKPYWYSAIRNFLVAHRGAQEVSGYEADDALSISQIKSLREIEVAEDEVKMNGTYHEEFPQETIICTRDKDLDMVPGWHYSWGAGKQRAKKPWWQDEIGGLRCFYKQLLTGDGIDNIPGLYGVGKSSKLLSKLDSMDSELSMYSHVKHQYELRFGSYWFMFLAENAQLLWMLREEPWADQYGDTLRVSAGGLEIYTRLKKLEDESTSSV